MAAATAEGAIEHALSRIEDVPDGLQRGFYTGLVGIGYVAVEAARCLGRPGLAERGLALIRNALAGDGETAVDVMSGDAGLVPVLLRLAIEQEDEILLAAAQAAGERLLAAGVRSERGLSWDTMADMARMVEAAGLSPEEESSWLGKERPHLTGYSHGAAGIALALLELGVATGDARFVEAARAGFAYEDSWFDEAADGWPDLRVEGPSAAAPSAWCHGATGIGLARLRAFALTGDRRFRDDGQRALRVAARALLGGFGGGAANYSLCHGAAGDAELFMLAAELLGDAEAGRIVLAVAWQGLESFAEPKAPWPSGVPGAGEAPGLMLGQAGTGYFYLRVADPAATPSILLVTPPRARPA